MRKPSLIVRLSVLSVLVAAVAAVTLARSGISAGDMTLLIERYGIWLPLGYVVAHVAASLLFIPRVWLALAAGYLFGLGWGIVWSMTGALAGAAAGFLIARYVNGGWIDLEANPRVGPWLLRAEAGGWRAVAAARLVPVLPHSLVNYALGLTRIPLLSFLAGSAAGMAPQAVLFVDLGRSGRLAVEGQAWLWPTLIGLAFLAVSFLVPRLLRRSPEQTKRT